MAAIIIINNDIHIPKRIYLRDLGQDHEFREIKNTTEHSTSTVITCVIITFSLFPVLLELSMEKKSTAFRATSSFSSKKHLRQKVALATSAILSSIPAASTRVSTHTSLLCFHLLQREISLCYLYFYIMAQTDQQLSDAYFLDELLDPFFLKNENTIVLDWYLARFKCALVYCCFMIDS